MLDKKTVKKVVKNYLVPYAKQNGFRFTKPFLLTRIEDDVLRVITFSFTGGFNCDIALQPLYVPSDVVVLSFGERLNHFKTNLIGNWGYGNTVQELENDMKVVMKLLQDNVNP